MKRSNGLYLAGAPVAFLVLLSGGARLLSTTAQADPTETVPQILPLPAPPSEKAADAETQRKLEKLVSGQMTALRKKDYAKALQFAASQFQTSLTPENFGQMVEARYASLGASVSAKFAPAHLRGSALALLPTTAVAKDGTKTMFVYILAKDAKGWSIAGCEAIAPRPHPLPTPVDEREI